MPTIYVGIMTGVSTVYITKAWQRQTSPVLVTWVIFAFATVLALWTALSFGEALSVNVPNLLDIPVTWGVAAVLVYRRRDIKFFPAEKLDKWLTALCLVATVVVFVEWLISHDHKHANNCIQVIMSVAYIPTWRGLYKADKNPEAYGVWCVIFIVSALAMLMGFLRGQDVAMKYGIRATVCVGGVLLLMVRLDYYLPTFALTNGTIPDWLRKKDIGA
ncbi:MAG: hypothetical protein HZA95_03660 [Candidatus Vogelbacteria bacterium]|nr:hypothetical protein [Candidatus Vogelbacteria bacterium]